MLSFIYENLSTIIVCIIILAVVVLAVIKIVKDRRAGKHSCGCGVSCEGCAMHKTCDRAK